MRSPCWQQADVRHELPDSLPGYLAVYLAYNFFRLAGIYGPGQNALVNLRERLQRLDQNAGLNGHVKASRYTRAL